MPAELALRFAFSCFDNNNDGVLTNGEFRDALGRLVTVPMSAETMDALINQLDADGDGTISIDEWIAFLQERRRSLARGSLARRIPHQEDP